MINALLDPNQIPLVRAMERRAGEPTQRPFAPELAAGPDHPEPPLQIEMEAQQANGTAQHIAIALQSPVGAVARAPMTPWVLTTQAFLLAQPAGTPAALASAPVPSLPVAPLLVGNRPAVDATATPASADASAPWQQRWLQWLQGQGADVQLRLRDFRLQERDYPRLIEQLHHFTREQGLTLTRLMVNGRELWRLPASETGVSHGR